MSAASAPDASPTPSALGQLALSSAPLTAATSLLRLLAPDVQRYIRQHEAEAAAAAAGGGAPVTAGESSHSGAASATRSGPSGGGGSSVVSAPLSLLSGGVAMRIATTSSVPDHAHTGAGTGAVAGGASSDIPFGRRRGATRTPSFTTLSPPLSPRGSARSKRTHTGSADHATATTAAAVDATSVHAQLQVDYAAATAAAAAASGGVSPSASAASLSASPSVTGAATSRGSRLRERERHALAMLHRAPPDADGAAGGGGGGGGGPTSSSASTSASPAGHSTRTMHPIVTPPLFPAVTDLHAQGAASDATAAPAASGATTLFEGGPRLFHSASRELLMGLGSDPGGGSNGGGVSGAQTSRAGPTHMHDHSGIGTASGSASASASASARASKKHLGSPSPSRHSGLSFTSAHASQASLLSSSAPGGGGARGGGGGDGGAADHGGHGGGRFHPPSPSAAFDSKDGYGGGPAADRWASVSASHDKVRLRGGAVAGLTRTAMLALHFRSPITMCSVPFCPCLPSFV